MSGQISRVIVQNPTTTGQPLFSSGSAEMTPVTVKVTRVARYTRTRVANAATLARLSRTPQLSIRARSYASPVYVNSPVSLSAKDA